MIRVAGVVLIVALLLALVLPFPIQLPLFVGTEPQQAWPLLWTLVAGYGALCLVVAEVSVPVVLLLAWMGLRTLVAGLPIRSVLVLGEVIAVMGLYVAVARARRADRAILWGMVAAGGVTAVIGVEDLLGTRSLVSGWIALMRWVMALGGGPVAMLPTDPIAVGLVSQASDAVARGAMLVRAEAVGLPHGLLAHPNFFGLFLALAIPAAWVVLPGRWRWAVLPAVGLVVASRTRAAIVAVAVVGGFAAWWRIGERGQRIVRTYWVGGAAAAIVAGGLGALTGAVSLGGRGPIWALGWAEALGAPWTGYGLGTWQMWALWPLGPLRASQHGHAAWWVAAFNEPLQLFFELGAVGVALGGFVLAQALRDAWHCRADSEGAGLAAMILVTTVTMWVTVTFHNPVLAVPAVLAAARLRAR